MRLNQRTLELAGYLLFLAVILALPLILDTFWLNRISKYLVYGMLGVAISLAWGYAGILNLGQGLFFGMGAYMLAMSLKLASTTSLNQGSDKPVPDFMLWNAEPGAITDLCCINKGSFLWIPFQNQWFGVAMGVVMPTLLALALGFAMFRARITGVYVAMITLALALLVRLLVIDAQPMFNGFNGLTDLGWFAIGETSFDPYQVHTYYLIAIALGAVLLMGRWLVNSKGGLILQAIRDDENRARYLGYDVARYKIFFFAVSAAIAGLAGMLYVIAAEFASPTFMNISFSVSMVVWAAVGGRNSLLGACIGAILLNVVEASVSETESLLNAWQLIIGAIFILFVVFLPRGLAGLGTALTERIGRQAR
ncbi:MAG TPA: urea ABC transporter permease subunit UrtC [Stellaceae bacterium]|nr:urea ABC transporter permease subunit UrtC [Stellaceae bacterium]